jgi:hypothetical protein
MEKFCLHGINYPLINTVEEKFTTISESDFTPNGHEIEN